MVDENVIVQIFVVALTATSVIVVILIGFYTIRHSKRQQVQSVLTDVFHKLNEKENREFEKKLIDTYKENGEKLYAGDRMNDDYLKCCDVIRRNYFKIGVLISENVVPDYPFYITFGYKLVQLYAICQPEIERGQRDTPEFASHFTNLAINCLDFYHKHADEDNKIKDAKTKEKIPVGKFGKERKIIKKPRKWFW